MASAISFPSGENLLNVIQGYHEEWGFPMCGDAIDGTHVPILAPNESHADCVNSKGYHSIIMQAVDYNNLYRAVNKIWIGFQIGLRIELDSGSDRTGIFAFGAEQDRLLCRIIILKKIN